MLLGIRRLGARRVERLFHPGARDEALPNGIVPFSQTEFTRRSADLVAEEIGRIRARGIADAVRGWRLIVGSSDTRVRHVRRRLGAPRAGRRGDSRPQVFLGGKLNTLEDGDSEPRDATDLLRTAGVIPCATVEDLVAQLD
ncbi:MAG TPA: hypothetical protein VMU39_12110 [Solirubrobacteraceae bacterium]|nr:hypothetical protein [Solirubrobacteraceae bacterium]